MNLELRNTLYRAKWYWKLRKWLADKPLFFLWKSFFSIAYFSYEEKKTASLLRRSCNSVVQGIIYAVASVVVFQYLQHLAPAAEVARLFNVSLPMQSESASAAIDSFLTTVASVSGVFLALYFAAISAVVGNLLISAPDRVQRLFLQEREGAQYMRTLVLTGAISVFYLTFKSAGYAPSLYSLAFLLIITIYNIVVFKDLGMRLFSLRSSEGAAYLTSEIARAIKGAGILWKNRNKPYIQNHFSVRATESLESLKELINFGIKDQLFSLEQMRELARYVGGLLSYYPEMKRRIPTNSLWFKTKRQHKKWILTDSIEISLALSTGTGLSPSELRDISWFERKVAPLLLTLQEYFLEREDIDSVVLGTEMYVQIFENGLGQNLSVEESQIFIEQIKTYLAKVYSSSFERKNKLIIADSDGRVAIGALLGYVKYVDGLSIEQIRRDFDREKIKNGDIYDGSIPQAMLARVEELSNNLTNEEVIDNTAQTPQWYVHAVAAFYLTREIKGYFEFIKTLHVSYFEERIDAFIQAGDIYLAAQLLQRWLEFCSKYQMCISVVNKQFVALGVLNTAPDLEWKTFDLEAERTQAEEFQRRAVDKMTQLLPGLAVDPRGDQEMYDYFGQSFTFGVEACYEACKDNNTERFRRLFPAVFIASIVAFNTTREDTAGWNQQSQIVFSSEPLVDILEISGYAKLYSELNQNPALWAVCEEVWNRYLSQEGAAQVVQIIAAALSYRETLFMIMPKGILRTNWEIEFRRQLSERGLTTDEDMFMGRLRDRVIDHPSKLIRIIVRFGILPVQALDIFIVIYLKRHDTARGIEFPPDRHEIERRLDEEEPADEENDAETP